VLGCEVSFQAVLPHHSLAPSWALHEVVIAACPVLLTWLAGELDIGSAAQRLACLPIGCEVEGACSAAAKATRTAARMLLQDV